MRRTLGLALLLAGVLVFSVGTPLAGAGTKLLNSNEVIADDGHLILDFEEGGLKKFTSVDYRLDATAFSKSCDPTGQQCLAEFHNATNTVTGVLPDDKGRVAATLTLSAINLPSPGPCTCGPRQVAYSDVTLTNLTTGHVYGLDSISRDFP